MAPMSPASYSFLRASYDGAVPDKLECQLRFLSNPSLDTLALYDVSQDGQRFLIAQRAAEKAARRMIRIVRNWFQKFRDREQD